MDEFNNLPDDGLVTPQIGIWGQEKYRLVAHYAAMFAKSMSKKWDCLVYLDLFSGSGRARIKDNNKIITSSPLLVLGQDDKFSQYIFNDESQDNSSALKERIEREYPDANVNIFCEDANTEIDKILSVMPRAHKGYRVLSFCFLDPFKMDNLKFSTLESVSKGYTDFLVLIPSDMDAGRNEKNYLNEGNKTVEEFLGNSNWREIWSASKNDPNTFGQFIVQEFGNSMGRLGFNVPNIESTVGIKNSKNRVMYRLALYSRSQLADKFWRESVKYTTPQRGFDF